MSKHIPLGRNMKIMGNGISIKASLQSGGEYQCEGIDDFGNFFTAISHVHVLSKLQYSRHNNL